jgi:cytochrome b
MNKILVWDLPVRIGHWLLVGAFALAWLTSESEEWRLVHAFAGGTVVGVVLFRLLWGIVGTRHARFASFLRGPGAAFEYLGSLLRHDAHDGASRYAGHNAAGGWAIIALLGLGLLTGITGWLTYQDALPGLANFDGEVFEELHEGLAAAMLMVAALHVGGVIVGSLAHRENLVRAMFTGRKLGRPDEAIAGVRPLAAVALLGWVAACAWWLAR